MGERGGKKITKREGEGMEERRGEEEVTEERRMHSCCISTRPAICIYIPVVFLGSLAVSPLQMLLDQYIYNSFAVSKGLDNSTLPPNAQSKCERNVTALEDEVDQLSSLFTMYGKIACDLPAFITMPIWAAYGDMYGRRNPVIIGAIGVILSLVVLVLISIFNLPIWVTLFYSGIQGFSGYLGLAVCIACAAHISHYSSPECRTMEMAGLELTYYIGGTVGNLGGGYMLKYTSFMWCFVTIAGVVLLLLIYCIVALKSGPDCVENNTIKNHSTAENSILDKERDTTVETVHENEPMIQECRNSIEIKDESIENLCENRSIQVNAASDDNPELQQNDLEYIDHIQNDTNILIPNTIINTAPRSLWSMIIQPVHVYFSHQHYKDSAAENRMVTAQLWLLLIIVFCHDSAHGGSYSVLDIFAVSSPLCWSPEALGYYRAGDMFVVGIGAVAVSAVCEGRVGRAEWLLFTGQISGALRGVLLGLATTGVMMYTSMFAGMLRVLCIASCRSMASMLVPQHQHGAAIGGIASVQILSDVLSGTLLSLIYAKTVSFYAGLTFLVTAAFYITSMPLTGWYAHISNKRRNLAMETQRHH